MEMKFSSNFKHDLSKCTMKMKTTSDKNLLPLSTTTLTLIHHLKRTTSLPLTSVIHSLLLKLGTLTPSNTQTSNHLIAAYLRSSSLSLAYHLFDEITHPDPISLTSLMSAYSHHHLPHLSLQLLCRMPFFRPNNYVIATALSAASQLSHSPTGAMLHSLVLTSGLHSDTVVSTALLSFYTKSNEVGNARKVFDRMQQRNVVSWGAMISGYAQNALPRDAIQMFVRFMEENVGRQQPNHFMMSSLVNACAGFGRLGCGKAAHGKVLRCLDERNEVIEGALIDMYAKCGSIEYATMVFDQMSGTGPSVVPYSSMIAAAAKYGLATLALDLFDEMVAKGVRSNEVTFVSVLHACSHSGLVEKGLGYLDSMEKVYGIVPSAKHYTCAVDMLGRAGRLDEAYEIVKRVGAKGDEELVLWCTLLSASRTHKRLDIAKEAGEKLREFNRDLAGAYMAMSNAYVTVGELEEAARVRTEMRRRGIRKDPGCSWVEVKDAAYVFHAGRVDSCPRGKEVVHLLRELEVRMEERGYARRRKWMMSPIEEEEEEGVVHGEMDGGVHSEILALGFGLLSFGQGVRIRVMKNLRMCEDCHEEFKLISGIVGREFVVRDVNRFHQFKEGACSCGDYW